MFPLFDAFLALPAVVIMLCVVMFWGTVAISVHRVIVPYLCGADGKKLVKFEAEVTSQIAVAFGLLLSFNAVWVWDRGDRVNHAVVDEALALATALDDSESMLTAEQSQQTRLAVGNYAHFLVEQEWPTLNDAHAVRTRPAELIALRKAAVEHTAGEGAEGSPVKSAAGGTLQSALGAWATNSRCAGGPGHVPPSLGFSF